MVLIETSSCWVNHHDVNTIVEEGKKHRLSWGNMLLCLVWGKSAVRAMPITGCFVPLKIRYKAFPMFDGAGWQYATSYPIHGCPKFPLVG